MNEIEISDLNVSFKITDRKVKVLKDLNLNIESDKISVVLGKSGCGKTTLLKAIKGLIPIEKGIIKKENLNISYVFQEPRLMAWLNVYENIIFGLKKQEVNNKNIDELIDMIGLRDFKKAYPKELSGGMCSRVSLARALATKAGFILMDEPFAALDYFTRLHLQRELIRLYKLNNFGVLFVTHSIEEAINIADVILIMDQGKIKKKYHKVYMEKIGISKLRSEILRELEEEVV